MPRGSNPHKFTAEQRQRGLEAARLKRSQQAAERRAAKTAADAQPTVTMDEVDERAKAALQPEESKGQKLELAKTFSHFLVLGTVLGAYAFQQPAVAMTNSEAGALSLPLANMFARSELNRQFGRYLTGSNDYVALAWGLFQYGQRVAEQWIHHEKIQPLRHSPEAGNGRIPAGGAAEPLVSPKSGARAPSPSDGMVIHRQAFGGAWRDAN